AMSYAHTAWTTALAFNAAFVVLFALAPIVATKFRRPLVGPSARAMYAAPILLFVFPVIARIEPAADAPLTLFAPLMALLVLIASLLVLLFLAGGTLPTEALWGLATLLAILNAGIFVESAAGELPAVSVAGGVISWLVLAIWWGNTAETAGILPSYLFLVVL